MSDTAELAEIFLRTAANGSEASRLSRLQTFDRVALAEALDRACASGRAAWPTLTLADATFVRFIAERVPLRRARDPEASLLGSAHLDDLYLACACLDRVPGAADAFERAVMSAVPSAIARVDSSSVFVDDIAARVRVKLLMGTSGEPRIGSYLGRGPLRAFAQVVSLREAQSAKRKVVHEDPYDRESLLDLPLGDDNPELVEVKRQLQGPFRVAFRGALAKLEPRERTILRLYMVEDVGSESIGRMYGVHRATVARWVADARASVMKETKRALADELELSPTSIASLIGKLATQLDITLSSFLAED